MRVLIGYDGSKSADVALEELKRAGIPAETQIMITSVGEVWIPPREVASRLETAFTPRIATSTKAQEQTLMQTEEIAIEAALRVRSYFPDWTVQTECLKGNPGQALTEKANDWKADLIIVGSEHLSQLGRMFLGSVSEKVITKARCSVRVARGGAADDINLPQRIILGIENAETAGLIIRHIARREWAKGSQVILITVFSSAEKGGVSPIEPKITAQNIHQSAKSELAAQGLEVITTIKEGNLKDVLLTEAERLSAGCIFLGARKAQNDLTKFLTGDVTTEIVANAPCSVEVVRPG